MAHRQRRAVRHKQKNQKDSTVTAILRETLGAVKTFEEQLAEILFDVLDNVVSRHRQSKELTLRHEQAFGDEAMAMRLKIYE